ncbi:RNA polymerase sigma factor [Pedobacter mendelii]|uniref:DNA-directed RNA polymerase sigma-70 factor n=1 Tax=Pedobacter mendelii TaxID=1908240 RepID=A0ABQ2BDK3_9SPHI|nr:RNA polymerase sigma-70 factor [Pedobacter mendelii]GGI23679.1 DNA-directed RNA polymerase sigma-70 factor [Pedobacter mendelii]
MPSYNKCTDNELAGFLKSGDRLAYEEIYHRYKFILHNHAWNKFRNKQEAEDALQEVFTKLWDKRFLLEANVNLSGYLYASVRNYFLNFIARKDIQGRYVSHIQKFTEEQNVLTDHRIRENQLRELIEKEIESLPARMREVFEMSRKEHLTHKEIAARLGTSEETIKKQISSVLKIMRAKFGVIVYLAFLFHRY